MKLINPPELDEVEVSLFGPGYGESIAVHLGYGDWMVVDSCLGDDEKTAAPLAYFNDLSIDPSSGVKLIVATHWHDDHIRGLAQIVGECSSAKFILSQAFRSSEFFTYTELWRSQSTIGSPVSEFATVFDKLAQSGRLNKNKHGDIGLRFAVANRCVWKRPADHLKCPCAAEIFSLSPSDCAIQKSHQLIASLIHPLEAHLAKPVLKGPNPFSVVLWIRVHGISLLLGADLEEKNNQFGGWKVIVESPERPQDKASLFKVPHHGSENGDHGPTWTKMLNDEPLAVLTPFDNGGVKLPKASDVNRICNRTPNAYITAVPTHKHSRPRTGSVNRTINETVCNIWRANDGFGQIRARKKIAAPQEAWKIELFGDASKLKCQDRESVQS